MTLCIIIEGDADSKPFCFDYDDPLYWFLYPCFGRVWTLVGKMVDLYDTAIFSSLDLPILAMALEQSLRDAESQNESWFVTVGYDRATLAPIERIVTRLQIAERTRELIDLTNRCLDQGGRLICMGD